MTSNHTVREGLGSKPEKCWETMDGTPPLGQPRAAGLLTLAERRGMRRVATRGRCPGAAAAAVAAVLAGTLTAPSTALASPELAQASRCMACHQIDRKVVGPAFREVGRRYAGRTDAVPWLARKIREGGGGAWGAVPMAANPHVSEADAKRLAQWILTLK